jgi:hypothetical protein
MTNKIIGRVGLLAALVGGGLVGGAIKSEAHGHPQNEFPKFSTRDVSGHYGMLELGQVEGFNFIEVAQINADGAGNLTIEAIGNFGGQSSLNVTLGCTYDVQTNGLGHMICHDPTGEVTSADMVLIDGGREVDLITTPSPLGYTYVTWRRQ